MSKIHRVQSTEVKVISDGWSFSAKPARTRHASVPHTALLQNSPSLAKDRPQSKQTAPILRLGPIETSSRSLGYYRQLVQRSTTVNILRQSPTFTYHHKESDLNTIRSTSRYPGLITFFIQKFYADFGFKYLDLGIGGRKYGAQFR